MTEIDDKINEVDKLLKEGKIKESKKLLSKLFLDEKLTEEQKDRLGAFSEW